MAAVLKAWSPGEVAVLQSTYGLPAWFSVALVACEWVLGALLLIRF